ncbi:hypothetical protein VTO58DRAFT_102564 [Aureobasidium pullulans]
MPTKTRSPRSLVAKEREEFHSAALQSGQSLGKPDVWWWSQPRADIFQNNPLPGPLFLKAPSHLPLVDFITSAFIPQKAASLFSHSLSITVASGLFHLHYTYPGAFSPATVYTLSS